MKFDLVAVDLDGTLLGADNQVSARVAEAIKAVQDRGVKVTIATGRMFVSARRFAEQFDIETPIICYQGAQVRLPTTGETISETLIPMDIAARVIQYCRENDYHVNAFRGDTVFMEELTPAGEFYLGLSGVEGTVVGNLSEWLPGNVLKLVIVTDEPTTVTIIDDLRGEFGDRLNVTRSYPIFAETIGPLASKGHALTDLAAHLDIPIERVMGIGDNLNDLDLVVTAGFGVAMGNGAAEVKAQADYITDHVDEDGVATALEKLILQA